MLAGPVRLFEGEVERPLVLETMAWLLARAGSVTGVEKSAVIDVLPGPGDSRQRMLVIRRQGIPSGTTDAVFRVVSPGYFATVGLGVMAGRPLSDEDREDSQAVAVINATLARQAWSGQSPIGQMFMPLDGTGMMREVVGIVEDGPQARGVPEVYLPYAQAPTKPSWFLLVRAAANPQAAADRVHAFLRSEELPHGEIRSLEEILEALPHSL